MFYYINMCIESLLLNHVIWILEMSANIEIIKAGLKLIILKNPEACVSVLSWQFFLFLKINRYPGYSKHSKKNEILLPLHPVRPYFPEAKVEHTNIFLIYVKKMLLHHKTCSLEFNTSPLNNCKGSDNVMLHQFEWIPHEQI